MPLMLKLGQEMVRKTALCRGDVWRSPEKRSGGAAKTRSPGLGGLAAGERLGTRDWSEGGEGSLGVKAKRSLGRALVRTEVGWIAGLGPEPGVGRPCGQDLCPHNNNRK